MILGERRSFDFLVYDKTDKSAVFNIRNAKFELYNHDVLEESGTCTINEHILTVTISPKEESKNYYLKITYEIADNIIKDRYRVEVLND